MKNKGFIITIIILVILILLFLFWHPFDYLKTTINTEAKSDSTTVIDTSSVNKQQSKKNTTLKEKNKQQTAPTTGSVSKVIVIIRDETTKQTPSPETKEQVAKIITEYTAPKSTQSFDVRTTLDPPKNKAEIIIFRFNADDGNHYPQLRFDELNDDATAMTEFPEAVWNNTRDGHNFKLIPTNTITGSYGITIGGVIYLEASSVAHWISNGIVDVKGSMTNWAFKRMNMETINGVEYYTCRIN